MSFFHTITDKSTTSELIHTGEVYLCGMHIGLDGINNPSITVFDGTDDTGIEIVPLTEYDAGALGLQGFETNYPILCETGLYIKIACAGDVYVITKYRVKDQIQKLPW